MIKVKRVGPCVISKGKLKGKLQVLNGGCSSPLPEKSSPFIHWFLPPPCGHFLTVDNPSFPGGASGKEPTCQCRRQKRCWFNPLVRKIPWRRKWQPTPVFLPGKSHRQRSLAGYSLAVAELDKIEAIYMQSCKLEIQVSHPHWQVNPLQTLHWVYLH